MQTKFLVVIPAYNAGRFLAETVRSIQSQTLQEWHLVIVDDGSTDDTSQLSEQLASADFRISVVHQQNSGLTPTRNAGWRFAKEHSIAADYLYFIDADDVAEPDVLRLAGEYMDEHPEVGCVYGDPYWWYSDEEALSYTRRIPRFAMAGKFRVRKLADSEADTPAATLIGWPAVIPSMCFFRASVFDQTGGWDENLRDGGEDIDQALHIAMYAQVHYLPVTFIKYRKHAASMNMDQPRYFRGLRQMREKWETYASSNEPNAPFVSRALNEAALIVAYNNAEIMRESLIKRDARAALFAAGRIVKNGGRYAVSRF